MGRFRRLVLTIAVLAAIGLANGPAEAKNIGADFPVRCNPCGCGCAGGAPTGPTGNCSTSEPCNAGACFSRTEGNERETYPVVAVKSSTGAMLNLSLTYDSYNADTSRARFNTVLGIGWTHSYNLFLFSQVGNMFRVDGDGRVTKYQLRPGGTFTAALGYFETIVKNLDGSFTITDKYQTKTLYVQLPPPGTPFMKGTPVWRLRSITDRNNNVTQLTYDSGGNLTKVTDTYGRTISFAYNSRNLITSITDPQVPPRTTSFTYDSTGTQLATITDPAGKTTQYSYNLFSQITSKTDKDGRVFTYSYTNAEPTGFTDGTGAPYFSMSNPNNWATDQTQLAMNQLRQYLPSTTSKTDGRGNVWKYSYDLHGYVTSMMAPDGATWSYTYDPATLMPSSQTDARGNTTTYKYDTQGNLIQQTDASPFGFVTAYTYEPVFNQITSMTDPNGRTTTYIYDSRGNRLSETDTQMPPQTRSWTYDSHGNVLTETDKRGNTTVYMYDAFGNRIQTTDREGNVWMATYDAVGNVITRTDPLLHVTQYEYDKLDRLIRETKPLGDPLQADTRYFYDNEGDRTQVIDRNDNATNYQYDQRRRLITIIDTQPKSTLYIYDNNNNRMSVTDMNGHTTHFGYDVQNRLTSTTDAENNTYTMKYDGVGNKISETDANIHTTFYNYDQLNRVTNRTDVEGFITAWKYDMIGTSVCAECTGPTQGSTHITEQIDGNGKVIYFTYDGIDRLDREIRKQGSTDFSINPGVDAVTFYVYDPNDNRIAVTEPDGNTTTYDYDKLDRQKTMTNAAGDVTSTTYDPDGNVKTVTAPNLNVTTNTYDSLDRLTQVDDLRGRVANYTYDPVGNRLTQTDGNGNGTTNTYDVVYRITDIEDALGKPSHYHYDAVGNLLQTTDRELHVTANLYDTINRRIQTTDALGNVTRYGYDGVGNLTHLQITDAVDSKIEPTDYAYDKINRLIMETYPPNNAGIRGVRRLKYDAISLISRQDQNGQVTNYTYSDLYFLLRRDYPTSSIGSPSDLMTYDLSGRMLTATRDGWPVTFTYDGADRVTNTLQSGQMVSYTYDVPTRTEITTYPGGRTTKETTDPRSHLARIDDSLSATRIVQYSYDPGNRVVQRDYRNSVGASYSYNNNDWVTNLQHSSAIPIAGFGYAYDNEGNKSFEQKLQDLAHSELYVPYDPIYRLTDFKVGALDLSTTPPTVPIPVTQTHYDLDGLGNWDKKIKDGVTESRTHDLVNEINTITIDGNPPCSLTYDNNGNLTSDCVYTYLYDEENRLLKVTRISDAVVVGLYQYDALSRRVQKIANPAGTPTTTRYFYDDARIIEEQDSSGTTQATYVYGNYVDEVLTMDRGGQTYYYHQNALWSVEAITDGTASVVERDAYDAYGLPTTLTSAIGNPYLFTGRQLDGETGIYFYRARYHDPVKGGFLQRDPADYVDGLNLYSYVGDRPTYAVDPSGTQGVKRATGVLANPMPFWVYPQMKGGGLNLPGTQLGHPAFTLPGTRFPLIGLPGIPTPVYTIPGWGAPPRPFGQPGPSPFGQFGGGFGALGWAPPLPGAMPGGGIAGGPFFPQPGFLPPPFDAGAVFPGMGLGAPLGGWAWPRQPDPPPVPAVPPPGAPVAANCGCLVAQADRICCCKCLRVRDAQNFCTTLKNEKCNTKDCEKWCKPDQFKDLLSDLRCISPLSGTCG